MRTGLVGVLWWTGDNLSHRSVILMPAIIGAYNIFMNLDDKLDQFRSTAPTYRKNISDVVIHLVVRSLHSKRIRIENYNSAIQPDNKRFEISRIQAWKYDIPSAASLRKCQSATSKEIPRPDISKPPEVDNGLKCTLPRPICWIKWD